VLGDLKVKVKDIINEGPGFFSSYAKGLLPQAFKDVVDTPIRGTKDSRLDTPRADNVPDSDDDLAAKMFDPTGEAGWEKENQIDRAVHRAKKAREKAKAEHERNKEIAALGKDQAASNIITPDDPDTPYNLADENLAPSERIKVETPAGTMYKYPDGRWYQIPSTGIPVAVPSNQYSALNDYADREGFIEQIPPMPKPKRRR
jgi:hypothetical protein